MLLFMLSMNKLCYTDEIHIMSNHTHIHRTDLMIKGSAHGWSDIQPVRIRVKVDAAPITDISAADSPTESPYS